MVIKGNHMKRFLIILLTLVILISVTAFGAIFVRYSPIFGRIVFHAAYETFLYGNPELRNKDNSEQSGSDSSQNEGRDKVPSDSGQPQKIEMSSGFVAYEYNKLNDIQKKIYDYLLFAVKNVEKDFVIADKLTTDDVNKAYLAVVTDHPETSFYFDGISDWNTWQGDNGVLTIKVYLKYRYESVDEIKNMIKQQDDAVNNIISSIIKSGYDEYTKELVIHNWLIEHCEYDYDASDSADKGDYSSLSFTSYNVFLKGQGVCQAYSDAMQMLCNEAGIECIVATGEVDDNGEKENHAWNIVKINGNYYQVDVTYDDVGKDTNYFSQKTYEYFNVTDTYMSDRVYKEGYSYPSCTAVVDNYYVRNGLHIDANDDASNIISGKILEKAQKGETGSEFRFGANAGGYSKKEFERLLDIVDRIVVRTPVDGKRYSIDSYWYDEDDNIFALTFERIGA